LQKSLSVMEGAPNRGVPEPFMRSGGKRFEWSVKGKPVRARSRSKTPTPPVNFGDPKRVKRHEARHSPVFRAKAREDRKATWSSGARSLKSGLFA
jgi:hypothetical protein